MPGKRYTPDPTINSLIVQIINYFSQNNSLKPELQKAVSELDKDRTSFQVLVSFKLNNSNGNGIADSREYNQEDI